MNKNQNNVTGPFTSRDWKTLRMLRYSIKVGKALHDTAMAETISRSQSMYDTILQTYKAA